MLGEYLFHRKRVLKSIPLFRGWKLIKEESDWEYTKRIAGLREIKLGWEGKEGGDKGDSRKGI